LVTTTEERYILWFDPLVSYGYKTKKTHSSCLCMSPLPINLTEHQIHSTNDRNSVSQQVAL